MKDPIQVDWRQYPIGTPAVFRKGNNKLELIWKDNSVFIFLDTESKHTIKTVNADGHVFDFKTAPGDILLPWSHAIAEGHNPDKLTNEQVGEGNRLVDIHTEPFNPEAEVYWVSPFIGWKKTRANKSAYVEGCTYRLPIKPKLSAKDFPPGTVVRSTGAQDNWKMITSVYEDRIYTGPNYIMISDMNSGIERSLDGGKTWLSC